MSADLDRLPADEEWLRTSDLVDRRNDQRAIQNVLDALNLFRCRAIFAEQELARIKPMAERARDDLAEARNEAVRNGLSSRRIGA